MKINEIQAKSILTKSGFPDDDYCINPYSGCTFGCSYCFADFMRRFTGHVDEKWGEYVDVKVNAPSLLEKELKLLKKRIQAGREKRDPSIVIGSVCDPYQGVEAKYMITRKCLEVIRKSSSNAKFNILTKSHLVTRDIDILKSIRNIVVGFTITTTDDKVSRLFEGYAPPSSIRLEALSKLNAAGIRTFVCINPLLPHFVANEKNLRKLFDAIRDTGNSEIWLEHLNLRGTMKRRVIETIKKKYPKIIQYFEESKTEEYKTALNVLILSILSDYDFGIGGGGVFDHNTKTISVRRIPKGKRIKKGWKYKEL